MANAFWQLFSCAGWFTLHIFCVIYFRFFRLKKLCHTHTHAHMHITAKMLPIFFSAVALLRETKLFENSFNKNKMEMAKRNEQKDGVEENLPHTALPHTQHTQSSSEQSRKKIECTLVGCSDSDSGILLLWQRQFNV